MTEKDQPKSELDGNNEHAIKTVVSGMISELKKANRSMVGVRYKAKKQIKNFPVYMVSITETQIVVTESKSNQTKVLSYDIDSGVHKVNKRDALPGDIQQFNQVFQTILSDYHQNKVHVKGLVEVV